MWCFGQKPNTDKGLSLSLLIVVWRHSVSLPGPNRTRNASQWAVGEFQRPPSDRSQQLPINDIPGAAATRSSTGMSNLRTRAPAQMDNAAILVVAAGDNPQRLRSEAAFAHLCGVAPLPASSGKVIRHRLNRGGNRQANHALYQVVLSRLASDPDTKRYVERRTKEGKSIGETVRMLKRYVAREVFKHLPAG